MYLDFGMQPIGCELVTAVDLHAQTIEIGTDVLLYGFGERQVPNWTIRSH